MEGLSLIRLVLFLAELNDLESLGKDKDNAYLEAFTKENSHIVAGLDSDL